jgi:peptide/nickel transport system substrate-binding protein
VEFYDPLALKQRGAHGSCIRKAYEAAMIPSAFRAAVLLLAVSAAGCGGGGDTGGAGAPLVMARVKDAVVLDPSHATDGLSLNTASEVMENLVTFKPGSFDVVPALATAWHANAAGTAWTFDLRPGAMFADGTPVDAAAVKFNFDRWRLPNDPNRGNFEYSYYADMFGGFPGVIRAVNVVSPARVELVLAHPFGPFLRDIAMPSFAIGSPAAIKADAKAFELKPVGSGPYTVGEWVRDDHITLTANPSYNGPLMKPAFGTVIIRDIPDQASSVLSIEKGEISMLTEPRADDAKTLAQQKGITVVDQPSNNLAYLALNVEKKPFDELRVREAIAYAIDASAIAKGLYAPGTVAAANWTPPGMLGENPALHPFVRNVARAKALLKEAGFPNGFSTDIYYPTAPRPYMPEPQRLAETLQAQLKDAGINATLQPWEFGVFLAKVRNGEHQMCLIGWSGDNGDPDNFLYPLLDEDSAHKGTAQNYSFWRDPKFHALMLAGQSTLDEAQRKHIYMQANAMIHDQVPAIPLVHTVVPGALSTSITGFKTSPDTRYHFELVKPAEATK